jgi:excisionase family DNA binding protein
MDTHITTQTCTDTSAAPSTELLTIPNVARRLTVSIRSVYRLIERGELPIVRILPDTPRVRVTDIDALITRRLTETDSPNGAVAGGGDSAATKNTV